MLDLHRHDEFSPFDGFGKAHDLAKLAKEKGLTALGSANHGTMGGLVEHWRFCKEAGIKPILGVEAYFQPKYNKKDPKRDSFHLCLFAENLQGYINLNKIMTYSNLKQRYYKPLCDFDLLEKYSEGVICTSGCIASFISQLIVKSFKNKERKKVLYKAVEKFLSIFGDNFYIELQPYKLDERSPDEKNLQERVNVELVKIAKKYDIKMVLTSDSHYGSEHDYDTYCKMHEIKGSGEFNETYRERYMPNHDDLVKRFVKMHSKDFGKSEAKEIALEAIDGLNEIEEKVDGDILSQLPLELPKFSNNSRELLWENIKKGTRSILRKETSEGKFKVSKKEYNRYMERNKDEYDVIVHHGFEDYFLIVQDYVNFAKRNYHLVDEETVKFWKKFNKKHGYSEDPIKVGPGRGSVCNSLVAYALNITEVDSLYFDIDFTRFLRMDKKKLPDIDLDFETDRRDEVIHYIIEKYKGKAAQICSFGFYKVDNLLNDLAKACGVGNYTYDEKGKEKFVVDQQELKAIKEYCKKRVIDDVFDYSKYERERECRHYNKEYDDIIKHFSKLYNKLKFIGTHAAGVAIVGGNLLDYTSIEARGSKDSIMRTTAYDLNNLEQINAIKFDMLGLRTLNITKELEEMTNECFSYDWLEDESVYEYFKEGKTDGIFQFERNTAKNILKEINADTFDDIIAASSLNRPGPLQLKMPEQYAYGKLEGGVGNQLWGQFTDKTYGTIVYQEQVTSICREIGLMTNAEADRLLKVMKTVYHGQDDRKSEIEALRKVFIAGAKKSKGMTKEQANELYEKLIVYTFNQGHATGYSLISLEQMWYKTYYPELFWYVTLKYANDQDRFRLETQAVIDGNVILIPHVNYDAQYSIVEIDGDRAIAQGISTIKGVGPKAAYAIEQERKEGGDYTSKENFLDRAKGLGGVNAGVIKKLEENGALLFDQGVYFERVKKYNSTLYMKGLN